ncbi:MAG TPA: phosphoribosyltransferase [Pseudonocardiaceae bacterium]|jgi:predicted phosphoribosyltransferase|nr:phosphoribosyltransferase [Pseudonocardiaceae bacterium]
MAEHVFRDRSTAGRDLAGLLTQYRGRPDVVVLGLARGGVPVAYEVATALDVPLDVFVVRKLGLPDQPELAMGAVAGGTVAGGTVVLNDDVVRAYGVPPDVVDRIAERERRELHRREREYRGGRPPVDVAGRTVILVDDGLATGASMRAAVHALRGMGPERIVVAVPTAARSTRAELRCVVDDVVCATTPTPFVAVGESYRDFGQTSDEQVRGLLRRFACERVG